MSDNQRHGKKTSSPIDSEETVDYTDFATQPAVEIDSETGKRVVQKPDGQSVVIDYDAARRRPAAPPNFNLAGHYDPPTNVDGKAFDAYSGPDNFAPTPTASAGPSTIPLDLEAAQQAWDALPAAARIVRSRAPVPPTGPPDPQDSEPRRFESELTDDELPTNQWSGRQLAEGMGTPAPTAESTPVPRPDSVSGGLTGGDSEFEVVAGIPSRVPAARAEPPVPPPAAHVGVPAPPQEQVQTAQRPPAPPVAPHMPPTARPQFPLRPRTGPGGDDEIDTNVMERFEEPSGLFVADEYEAAAIRRSPWILIAVLTTVGALVGIVAILVVLAFAGGGAVKLEQLIREQISTHERPGNDMPPEPK